MLQIHLLQRVDAALAALTSAEPLIKVIEALDNTNTEIDVRLSEIAEGGGNKIQESASSLHSQFASLPNITRTLSSRKLFREVEMLQHRLSAALGEGVSDNQEIVFILDELDGFAEAYNTYVAHQAGTNALPLLLISRRTRYTIARLRGFLEYIRNNTINVALPNSGESEFSLVLHRVVSLSDFAEKLTTLDTLYAELCYVLNISAETHPIRVAKIESGSLLTRLLGDTRVVGLMLALIEGSVKYFHRSYTAEGKITAIPKRIESLDAILNFSNRLKESGVDVSDLNETLAKSAVSITNSLNALVSDQPVVEINDQIHSIGRELQAALIEQASTPKLEYTYLTTPALSLNPPDGPKGAV